MYFSGIMIECFLIVSVCTTFCGAAYLPSITSVLEDSGNVNSILASSFLPSRSKRSACATNTVSLLSELVDLGNERRTVCPFEARPKSLELEHPAGTVSVQFNQILCSGACTNNCDAGRSCKQLKTKLQIKIYNAETGLPDRQFDFDANIGCSCTPDDAGSPGEVVSTWKVKNLCDSYQC